MAKLVTADFVDSTNLREVDVSPMNKCLLKPCQGHGTNDVLGKVCIWNADLKFGLL